LSYVKLLAVSRAPGNAAHNRGAKRSPAKAGHGARDAKAQFDKRIKMGKSLTSACGASASCLMKQGEELRKWANDNLEAAAKEIEALWRRAKQAPPHTNVPADDEAWDEDGD